VGNRTTYLKSLVISGVTYAMAQWLGFDPLAVETQTVATAVWIGVSWGLAYLLPHDLGIAAALQGVQEGAGCIVALVVATSMLAGCPMQPPKPGQPPATAEQIQQHRERQCRYAELSGGIAVGSATFALTKIKSADARLGVQVAIGAVDSAVAGYCKSVRAGEEPDGVTLALNTVLQAIGDLSSRVAAAKT